MNWGILASLLALSSSVHAQVTVCRATYGSEATSVANSGRQLLIQVIQDASASAIARRQAPIVGFLASTGTVQTFCQRASILTIKNGRLFAGNNQYSAPGNVPSERFVASPTDNAVDTIFGVTNETLVWDNPAFDGRTARFCVDAAKTLFSVFTGPLPADCVTVSLRTLPLSACAGLAQTSSISPSTTMAANMSLPANETTPISTNGLSSGLFPVSGGNPSTTITGGTGSTTRPTASNDLVAQASSIISADRFARFCSQYLGYDALQAAIPYETTVVVSTTITSTLGDITRTRDSTVVTEETVPTVVNTIFVTPTSTVELDVTTTRVQTTTVVVSTTVTASSSVVAAPARQLANFAIPPKPESAGVQNRALQRAAISIPGPLETYQANIISSACSLNAVRPTSPTDAHATFVSTAIQTAYVTEPVLYVTTTILVPTGSIVRSGSANTTVTAPFTRLNSNHTATVNSTFTTTTIATSTVPYVPSILLPSPTAIVGNVNGAPLNVDDNYYLVDTPFPISLFGHSSSKIYVSTNGVLSLDYPPSFASAGDSLFAVYDNVPIHTVLTNDNGSTLPDYSICAFWDDQYIYAGQPQGIYYEVDQQFITFEFYLSKYGDPTQYYHYQIVYDEIIPDAVTLKFIQVSDLGSSATVGVQGAGTLSLEYSYNTPNIVPGLNVYFDTVGMGLSTNMPS